MTSNNPRPQQPVSPYYAPQLQLKIAHCRATFTKVQ